MVHLPRNIRHSKNHFDRHKVVSAKEAVALIHTGDTLATSGFVGIGFAEALAIALRERFEREQAPQALTLLYAAGQGDGKERGLNHLACERITQACHWRSLGLGAKTTSISER